MDKQMKNRLFLRFSPAFFFFLFHSSAFADDIYEPGTGEGSTDVTLSLLAMTIAFIIWIIQLVARGRMLNKKGENGWMILVPLYGRYQEYIRYWKEKYFWINCALAAFLLLSSIFIYVTETETMATVTAVLWLVMLVVFIVNRVRMRMKTVEVFGFDRKLGLLELLGLGFVTDCLCGFSNKEEKTPAPKEIKKDPEPQEPIDSWE